MNRMVWLICVCLGASGACQQARVAGSYFGLVKHRETEATVRTSAFPLRWYDADEPCGDGAELRGRLPPAGEKVWCELPEHRPHGRYSRWWPNGQRREEGAYCRGRRHGPWTVWDERGQRLGIEWLACNQMLRSDRFRDGRLSTVYDHRDPRRVGWGPPVADCQCPPPTLPPRPR